MKAQELKTLLHSVPDDWEVVVEVIGEENRGGFTSREWWEFTFDVGKPPCEPVVLRPSRFMADA